MRKVKKNQVENNLKEVDQVGLMLQLNWYQLNSDTKESKSFLYDYLLENGKSTVVENLKKSDFPFHPTDGYTAKILSNGIEIPENSFENFNRSLQGYFKHVYVNNVPNTLGLSVIEDVPEEKIEFIDPALSELGEVELQLDAFIDNAYKSEFSMLGWLHEQKPKADKVDEYIRCYVPLRDELEMALTGDTYCRESYSYMTKGQIRKYFKFVSSIVEGCEEYNDSKRKVRKKKVKTPTELVKKLKYSVEGSVKPSKIIGASHLWAYDTKLRYLTCYISSNKDGLTVTGTSIRNYNTETSTKKKIYASRVDDTLNRIKVSTKNGANSFLNGIKAKAYPTSGRINNNTILLKVYNEGDD